MQGGTRRRVRQTRSQTVMGPDEASVNAVGSSGAAHANEVPCWQNDWPFVPHQSLSPDVAAMGKARL